MISAWARRNWDRIREQNSLLPPTSFLSQELQDHLCERFHVITSIENLSTVLAGWPRLGQYKAQLFLFCQEALRGLGDLRKEVEEKSKAVEKSGAKEASPLKFRIRPPLAPVTQTITRDDESGRDSLKDGEPPKKKRRGVQGQSHNVK
jgi:hypothetical protein